MSTDNRFSSKLVSQKKLKYLFECAGKMKNGLVGSVEVLGSVPFSPSQSLYFCSRSQGLCLTINQICDFLAFPDNTKTHLLRIDVWKYCGDVEEHRCHSGEAFGAIYEVALPQDCWLLLPGLEVLLLLEWSKKWDGFKSLLISSTDYWGVKQSWNLISTSVLCRFSSGHVQSLWASLPSKQWCLLGCVRGNTGWRCQPLLITLVPLNL